MLTPDFDTLKANAAAVRRKIAAVCRECGRNESEVTLIAATKTVASETVALLPACGISVAGENRVQEFLEKADLSGPVVWHLIGALQTNKVKYVVGRLALIQSVDRLNLAEEIERIGAKRGVVTNVLIEVNACGEASKSGVDPAGFDRLTDEVRRLGHLKLRGIMSVLPIGAPDEPYLRLKEMSDRLKKSDPDCGVLSMGMSGDYKRAIRCGSTMIRLGSALFGQRSYPARPEEKNNGKGQGETE